VTSSLRPAAEPHDAAGYALHALDPAEKAAFEAHLAWCDRCAAELRSLGAVTAALVHATEPADPSPPVRARILAAVRTPRRRRLPIAWLAAAASLVIAIAMAGYARQLRARAESLTRQLRQTEFARRGAEARVAVLSAPDVAHIGLAGQPVAPQASGDAFWSRSRGLVFTAANLPSLPAGRTYQVWVVTDRAPLSAGLITPDPNGRVDARFSTPLDMPPPVAVALTDEPAGGVPAPTGEKYLVGLAQR
jgi:hypothetical protein